MRLFMALWLIARFIAAASRESCLTRCGASRLPEVSPRPRSGYDCLPTGRLDPLNTRPGWEAATGFIPEGCSYRVPTYLVRDQRQGRLLLALIGCSSAFLSRRVTFSGTGRQRAYSNVLLDNGVVLVASAAPYVYRIDRAFCASGGIETGKP